jgi:tetratricopeptide (TPR) repeat protein
MDNPIHKILSIESEVVGNKITAKAYPVINDIIKVAREKIKVEMSPVEKLVELSRILREDFKIQYYEQVNLSEGLSAEKKVMNCVGGSHVFIAVAHELGWPVYLASYINHAFVFWRQSENKYFGFETTNGRRLEDLDHWNMLSQEGESIVKGGIDYVFAGAYYCRAHEHNRSQRHEKAIEDCTKAIELRPDFSEAYTYRGYAHYELGQKEETKKDSAEEQARNDWAMGNKLVKVYRVYSD